MSKPSVVARKFRELEEKITNDEKAIKQSMEDVQDQATQAGWKGYKSRSGNLDKAYSKVAKNAFTGVVELTKARSNTPYAHAIHSGRPDWRNYNPPKFLTRVGGHKETRDKIEKNFQTMIKNNIRKIF